MQTTNNILNTDNKPLIRGVAEDNTFHVTLMGNPADMVTHLIGMINGTLESIADCLMYGAENFPDSKDEFFVCAANFLIGYYRSYKHDVVAQQPGHMPIFEAFRNLCERFDAYIDSKMVIDLKLDLPSEELNTYMTHEELGKELEKSRLTAGDRDQEANGQ